MRDEALDNILNPPHEELHVANCSWHKDWHACDCGALDDRYARSSVEEQEPSKPKVAGSTPAGRDIQIAQLKLAEDVAINLIRDCPEHTRLAIRIAFSSAIEQLDL